MKRRISKINQLIKKELAQILLKETDFPKEILVTLTRVETLPNLLESKVYISVFPEKKNKEVLNSLKKRISFFQREINKKLKMKRVPKLVFVLETKTITAGKVEEILAKIKKQN